MAQYQSRRISAPGSAPTAHRIQPLLVVLFVFTMLVLATVLVPRYADGFQHARIVRAQWDVRTVADAITLYALETGRLPSALADLTTPAKSTRGDIVGPFLLAVPAPPGGGTPPWGSTYRYVAKQDGTFVVFAAGDNAVVSAP